MEKKNKLSLVDTVMQALMLVLLMIGGHQIYVISKEEGFKIAFFKSYWIFMFVFVLIIIYQMRKSRQAKAEGETARGPKWEKKPVKKKKR